jgi:hypothetical protein
MPQDDKTACKLSAVDNAQAIHGPSGQLISQKSSALFLVAAAYILGGGGMLAWLAFLLMGPLVPLSFELGHRRSPAAGHTLVPAVFHPAQHHGPAPFSSVADSNRSC